MRLRPRLCSIPSRCQKQNTQLVLLALASSSLSKYQKLLMGMALTLSSIQPSIQLSTQLAVCTMVLLLQASTVVMSIQH